MTGPQPDVVCFGMITPATVLVVDEFPEHNTGVAWRERADFISDDAAIIAVLLKQWGVLDRLDRNGAGRRSRRALRRFEAL